MPTQGENIYGRLEYPREVILQMVYEPPSEILYSLIFSFVDAAESN